MGLKSSTNANGDASISVAAGSLSGTATVTVVAGALQQTVLADHHRLAAAALPRE